MKRISTFFGREKKASRADETNGGTLTNCEEEEMKKDVSKKRKDKKDKDKTEKLRPNHCSVCGAHYRVCVCGHCYICDAFVLSMRGMRHCPRCWKPICDGCTVFPKGDAFLHEDDDYIDESFLCENCSHISAIRELSLLPDEYVPVLEGKSVEGRITYHFSWGLYMLLRASSEPRICLNPSCNRRRRYRMECEACAVPTLPSILFDCCRTSMLALRPQDPPMFLETSTISALNKMYNVAQKSIPAELSEDQADVYASNVFPFFREHFNAFPNGLDSPASTPSSSVAMRAMLSTIAINGTEVPRCASAAQLSVSDHPLSLLLHLRTAEKTHCLFGSAGGGPEFIAFSPSSGQYSDIAEQLQSRLVPMEIWRCSENDDVDANGQQRIGFIARNSDIAAQQGGSVLVFPLSVVSGLYEELESPALTELKSQIIAMRQSGAELVLCGHGIGGSLATLLTLVLLIEHTELMAGGIQCITFGAPGVINGTKLIEYLEEMQLSSCFHHFVYRSDIFTRFHYLSAFLNAGEIQEGWGGEGSLIATDIKNAAWNWFDKMRLYRESLDFEANPHNRAWKEDKKEKKSKGDTNSTIVSLGDVLPSVLMSHFKRDRTPSWFKGDLFYQHREPFDNNLGSVVSNATSSAVIPTQFGCYHCFYLNHDRPYEFCNSYKTIQVILSQRKSLPLLLRDHLMTQYSRTLIEYLHSYNVCPEGL